MKIEEIYSNEYLEEVYFSKMCINCSKNCSKCTGLNIERLYQRYKGRDIPTVIYKCDNFLKKLV